MRFEAGQLLASRGYLWSKRRVLHLIADIDRFEALSPDSVDDDFLRLYLVTREGAKIELPFDLGSATVKAPAPANQVLQFLGETLDAVRREGHSYRTTSPTTRNVP